MFHVPPGNNCHHVFPRCPLFLLRTEPHKSLVPSGICTKCTSYSCWELYPLHLLFRLGTVPSVFLASTGNCACAQCVPTVSDWSCTQCVPVPTGNCAQCASCSCWKLCSVCLLFLLGAVPSASPVPARNYAQYLFCS